ncbi:MAG: hypothetical protein JXR49_02190, partial [Acidobacteria bacterium]|nr:hypothetical protein [Acidobacteriota bacterium]
FLSGLAAAGGGSVIDRNVEILPETARKTAYANAWPYLATIALFTFLADILFRRALKKTGT